MPDSDIVTRCPKCNTAFRVTPNQLAVADGVVRCGSCLAVFKAMNHKAENDHSPLKPQIKSPHNRQDTSIANPQGKDNLLIQDDNEEPKLSLTNNIYDLEITPTSKSDKTGLFDRQLKSLSHLTRENTDESWALDMLADLENDDDIKPIIKKRKAHESETIDQTLTSIKSISEPNEKLKDQYATQLPTENAPGKLEPTISNEWIETNEWTETDEPTETKKEGSETTFEQEEPITTEPITTEPIFVEEPAAEAIIETLHFDHDIESLEQPVDTLHSSKAKGSLPLAQISDEDINTAIQSDPSYASNYYASNYIESIEPAPVEMEWYESKSTQHWLWFIGIGIALASLALFIQISIFRFDTLSKNPNYRQFYETPCRILGCRLPTLIDTTKIRTTNLHMRKHPSQTDALVVDAIIINTAPYKQPYPELRLEFSNSNNQLVAARNLQPSDYLRGELAGAIKMPANQPIQLSLDITHPGKSATGYQLTVVEAH